MKRQKNYFAKLFLNFAIALTLCILSFGTLKVYAAENEVSIIIDNSESHLAIQFYPDTNDLDDFIGISEGEKKTITISKDSVARMRVFIRANGHYVPDDYKIDGATRIYNDDRINMGWCRAAFEVKADEAKTITITEASVCKHPYVDPKVRWGYRDCGDGTHVQSCTLCATDIEDTVAKHTLSEMTATEYADWYYEDANFQNMSDEEKASRKASMIAYITEKLGVDANTKINCCTMCEHYEKIEKPEIAKVKLNKTKANLGVGKTIKLKATITPSDVENEKLTWSSSNDKIAKVDKNGKVTGVKAGTATITVKTANGKKASCKVTVVKATLNATSLPLQVKKNVTLKVTSTLKGDKVKSFSSSNDKIATVSSKGVVKGVKKGSATITVIMKSGATAKCKVTVQTKAVTTKKLTLDKTKATLKVGKTLTLNVTRNPISATDKITWSSSNKKIATVDKNGKVKALKAGKVTIKAKVGKKTVKCTITVKKK